MTSNEVERLRVLQSYAVMDTPPDPALDRMTSLARKAFDTPIALVSLVDESRQWFKSNDGLEACETDRDAAFCAHALDMECGSILVVPDATRDPRFAHNPLVTGPPHIRFYAGAVLTSPEGANLGTLCIIDTRVRSPLTPLQQKTLRAFADLAMAELEIQRSRRADAAKRQLLDLGEAMSGVGHWRLEMATGRVEWSDEVYRIHGVHKASFDPSLDDALAFYDEVGRAAVQEHIAKAARDRAGFSFQLRIRRADGDWRDVMCRATCEVDAQDSVTSLVGVFQDVTEQERLLQRVKDDRERYRLLTQNATDVIATYEPDGTFTYLSPSITKLLGRHPSELVGRKTYVVVHRDDQERVTSEFLTLLKTGASSRRIEYRAVKADGDYIWVEAHPTPIYDQGGRVTGFQDVVRDVSERRAAQEAATAATRQAEAALACARESEARYRLLAENANDMIATSSLDSTILFVTPAVRRLLGYEPEELVGVKTLDLTHPEDVPEVIALFKAMVSAGKGAAVTPYQFRGRHKDGRWIWLEGQPRMQFNSVGCPVAFQDVVRDISARQAAQEATAHATLVAEEALELARENEGRYRLLAENATDMISRYGLDGVIRYVSPACGDVLGFTPEELVGRTTLDFVFHEDLADVRAMFAVHLSDSALSAPMQTEHRVVRKDGSVIWLEGRPRLIRDEQGHPLEYHDVMREVTARKRLQAELEQAKVAAEAGARVKGDFLANMSHELRTPLNSIVGFSGLIAKAPELAPETRRRADLVHDASRSLVSIVNDVLDFSKMEAEGVVLDLQPTDVETVLEQAADLVREEATLKGLRLDLEVSRLFAPVMVDPSRMRQVVLNLLGNAVKFTRRGRITLSLSETAQGRLRIAVRDTGIGIAPDRLAAVFDRFAQADGSTSRQFGGTGLGLAISRNIVLAMGGEMDAESQPGEGSTFWFTFAPPLAHVVPSAAASASATAFRAKDLRVLLADDNEVNRDLFKALLSPHGLVVTEAEDGLQALAACQRADFDIVFMDVQMPVMDGIEATRALRARGVQIPIVALTANVLASQVDVYRQAGMSDHLSKPYEIDDVLRVIAAHVPGEGGKDNQAEAVACIATIDALRGSLGKEALNDFLARLAQQLEVMAVCLAQDDAQADALARQAHGVRGLAGTLGFEEINRSYAALEARCREADSYDIELEGAICATRAALGEIQRLRAA